MVAPNRAAIAWPPARSALPAPRTAALQARGRQDDERGLYILYRASLIACLFDICRLRAAWRLPERAFCLLISAADPGLPWSAVCNSIVR